MTPKEGIISLHSFHQYFTIVFCLATVTKRISSTDALAAANMSLFIRGPSPNLPGVCTSYSNKIFIEIFNVVKRNRYRNG